jgi:chorismate mutase
LIQVGGLIGQLTAVALQKIKERILVVKQVEKIKQELHKSETIMRQNCA